MLDEDQTFEGHDGIRRWRETVTAKFAYTIEALRAETAGSDGYVITAKLEGNFPGSPVELQFQFRLRDGLIVRLEIAP